jgi:ribonuclease J
LSKDKQKPKLRIIPLGGLQEIGKNLTAFEYENDMIVVDCGVAFPEDEMLGIDLVIPDFTYLVKNKNKLRGIVLTHGHEDHIGSIPYIYRELNVPLYATRLTMGLVEVKLKEHNQLGVVERVCVKAGETVKLGRFEVEFIATTHSIADSAALAIHTPVGAVIHSGDFKIDHTPIGGASIDLQRFAELGKRGVLLFLCDSTNIESPGYTMSERSVGAALESIFRESRTRRIMVATFSSNIHRIQQVVYSAVGHGRKVAVVGRSMSNCVETACDLGYLEIPDNTLIDVSEINNYPDGKIVIITTGSQGEPMSALSRMASSDHRQVAIKPGDKIILSSSSIPGNEKSISRVINELFKKGAEVIYEGLMDTHVSGHAKREELKLMHALTRPKFFMPVHGEYRHLRLHKELAVEMGMNKDDVFVMGNGDVLEVNQNGAKLNGAVPAGQVFVDGLGVGDVGNIVLRDRKHLSEDGLIIVVVSIDGKTGEVAAGPDIISRGFVYVRESEDLMDEARRIVQKGLDKCAERRTRDWSYMKNTIKEILKEFVWQKTKRSPMILPVIMEI